jgi:hypothetical protein
MAHGERPPLDFIRQRYHVDARLASATTAAGISITPVDFMARGTSTGDSFLASTGDSFRASTSVSFLRALFLPVCFEARVREPSLIQPSGTLPIATPFVSRGKGEEER